MAMLDATIRVFLLKTVSSISCIILFVCFSKTNAQNNTFLLKLKDYDNAKDIQEDDKGCLVAGVYADFIKINPNGRILWQTRWDIIQKIICFTDTNEITCFGAGIPLVGSFEYIKLNLKGKIKSTILEDPENETHGVWDAIYDSARKQFVVCGWRYFIKSNQYKNYWIAGVDVNGKILWEQNLTDLNHSRYFRRIFKNNKTGGYFLLGNDEKVYGRHELFNVDSVGRFVDRYPIEPSPCQDKPSYYDYIINDISPFHDSLFIASISVLTYCNPTPEDGSYYYVYNCKGKLINRIKHFWVSDFVKETPDKGILLGGGNFIAKLDANLNYLWSKEIYANYPPNEAVDIKKIYPSRDGGFYGIAEGDIAPNGWSNPTEHWVYIFKTDSLGNIKPTPEYSEKLQLCMLQPNPAMGKVRIAIPYYYGTIQAQFYTMQGQMMLEQTQNEADNFDIRSLSAGIYVVHAKITETGEVRKMKLVVQ